MGPVPNPNAITLATAVTISNLNGDSFSYPEQSGTVPIDRGEAVSVTANLSDFTGLIVTVSIGGMSSTQILSIYNNGNGQGQIGFQNGSVTYGGQTIAEAFGGVGEPLTIVLSATDAVAVTALLRSLNYADTGDAPEATTEITVGFSDDNGVLASAVAVVNAVPEDDLPVANNDELALGVGDTVAGNLTGNDFDPDDPDGGALQVIGIIDAGGTNRPIPGAGSINIVGTYGTLTVGADGAFTYTSDHADSIVPGDTATETFSYTIADEDGGQTAAIVKFMVTAPPLFRFASLDGDTLAYPEGSAPLLLDAGHNAHVVGDLPALEGIILTVALDQAAGSETLSVIEGDGGIGRVDILEGGIVKFDGNEVGFLSSGPGEPLSIVFTANATNDAITALVRRIAYADESDAPANKTVNFTLSSGTTVLSVSHVSVTAEPEPDDPVANGDVIIATAGGSLTGNVIQNDFDPDDTAAVLTVVTFGAGLGGPGPQVPAGTSIQGEFGTLTLNADGTYTYLANNTDAIPEGSVGQDVFTYSITSSAGGEAMAQLAITVENPLQQPLFTFSNFDGDALDYIEQSGALIVDHDVSVTSGELGWDGTTIQIDLGGTSSGESIGLRHQGLGIGQIGLSGSNVSYSGNIVGSITRLSDVSFKVLLNSAASDEIVSAILRNIQYDNQNEVLNSAARTMTVTVRLNEQAFGADTATFQITPSDDPLLPVEDAFVVAEDATISGNVFENDVDPDRPPPLMKELMIRGATVGTATPISQNMTGPLVLVGRYGSLTINQDGTFIYNANLANDLIAGESGREVFTYLVRNDTGDEATAHLIFTVKGSDEIITGTSSPDILTGGRGADQINGLGGNDRLLGGDGADVLTGDTGDDTLDGGAGVDLMYGSLGNDTFMVDNAQDVVVETQKGNDVILTTSSFTLQKRLSIEVLQAVDSDFSPLQLVGNELSQSISGGSGADTLNGKAGADILKGGKGRDIFIFDSLNGGKDTILDFKLKEDKIHLVGKAFGLRKGKLKLEAFVKIKGEPKAQEEDDRILYDRTKGYLYADLDGSGGRQPVLLGVLKNKPDLGAKDFFII